MPGCCQNASDGAEERPSCWGSGDGWEDAFLSFFSGYFALHLFLVWSRIRALCHAGVTAGSDPQLLGCSSVASADVEWSWSTHVSFGTGFFILCVNAGQYAWCVGTLQVFHGTPVLMGSQLQSGESYRCGAPGHASRTICRRSKMSWLEENKYLHIHTHSQNDLHSFEL